MNAEQLGVAANLLANHIFGLDEYHRSQRLATYFAVNGEIGLDEIQGCVQDWIDGKVTGRKLVKLN